MGILNVVPSKVKFDSAVAVLSPSDVKTLFAPSFAIELIATVTVANVESPLKKVEEFAVPDPNLAVGTVPDAMLDAFKAVMFAPLPYNVSAYTFLHLVPVNPKSLALSAPGIVCPSLLTCSFNAASILN